MFSVLFCFAVILDAYSIAIPLRHFPHSVISTAVEKSAEFNFQSLSSFFQPLRLASAHRRRKGSFFSLDRKETKDQGLDLMSDKFVKASRATVSRLSPWLCPPLALDPVLDCARLNGYAKALTFSPSFRSYAGWQGADSMVRISTAKTQRLLFASLLSS